VYIISFLFLSPLRFRILYCARNKSEYIKLMTTVRLLPPQRNMLAAIQSAAACLFTRSSYIIYICICIVYMYIDTLTYYYRYSYKRSWRDIIWVYIRKRKTNTSSIYNHIFVYFIYYNIVLFIVLNIYMLVSYTYKYCLWEYI